jgi:cell division protease FtsH
VRRLSRSVPFVIVFATVVAFAAAASWRAAEDPPEVVRFDELVALVRGGQLRDAVLAEADHRITAELVDGRRIEARYPSDYGTDLAALLTAADPPVKVEVDHRDGAWWTALLVNLIPLLILGVVVLFLLRSFGGGGRIAQFGRAKSKLVTEVPDVRFVDVAGADEAVEELQEIRDFLADPERFVAMGARIPRGVLLHGPPGTGKTLLARAVAGEAGVPFLSISGSDFVEMFVGVGASRVRDLFAQARAAAPAIVFVDEIDAVGRHRGAGVGGGHDEREQTLNQLLVEMDGFDGREGVIVIAATNRPDILDPALLRPGRFDRHILVDRPDLEGRRAIAAVHARGKPLTEDVSIDVIARRTPGFTGADLANLFNEAALLATRRGRTTIGPRELEKALDRVLGGPERRGAVLSERERRIIAYHEAGHAVVGHVLPTTDPIHKVSIVARGRALGWTLSLPEEDRHLRTRSELRDELAMLLGGRVAEEVVFGEPSTGAANDIERASALARAMVTEFGMSPVLGAQHLARRDNEVFLGRDLGHGAAHSEEIAAAIDAEVTRLIEDAGTTARGILIQHRAVLERLADALITHETIEDRRLAAVLGGAGRVRPPRPTRRPADATVTPLTRPRSSAAPDARTLGAVPSELEAPGRVPARPPSGED